MEDMEFDTILLADKPIVWTFAAMKKFEARVKGILKKLEIKPGANHTGYFLANYLRITEVLEAAVTASTGLDGMEGKKGEPSEALQAIEDYLEQGGTLDDLQKAIYRAFLEKNDPSSIPLWLAEVRRNLRVMEVNQMKEEAKLEIARLELEADQKKIEEMKASGKLSTESDM